MLELRGICEACQSHLPPDSDRAWICSYECTFCSDCVHGLLKGTCPNCGGELVRRPRRVVADSDAAEEDPASGSDSAEGQESAG